MTKLASVPRKPWIGAIALIFGLASCAAPIYDPQTHKNISDLQQLVDSKIASLMSIDRRINSLKIQNTPSAPSAPNVLTKEWPFECGGRPLSAASELDALTNEASFACNRAFYGTVNTDLNSAQMGVDSSPDFSTLKINDTFQKLRQILVEEPTSMEGVHASQGLLGVTFLQSTRTQVNSLFAILLRYERTVEAGQSPSK